MALYFTICEGQDGRPSALLPAAALEPRGNPGACPLETALAAEEGAQGETVPVRLHSNVNEVGILELWCQSTRDPRRWKLEFNVREPSQD
jgi:hypothetical protein